MLALQIQRPPDEPRELPPPPDTTTLGGKVELTLETAFKRLLHYASLPFAWALQWGMEFVLEIMRKEAKDNFGSLINDIRGQSDISPEIKHLLDYIMEGEGELVGFLATAVGGSAVGGTMGSFMGAMTASITRWAMREFEPMLFDPQAITQGTWRGIIDPVAAHMEWASTGWAPWREEAMQELLRPLLSEQILIDLWRRERMSEAELDTALAQRGYVPERIERLKAISEQIPGAGDLISMAVREAWREDFAAQWGTDQDFPEEFATWMERQGFDRDWAKRYWRAHWQLPSLRMGFEMFQRREMTREELESLLRAQDIMPGYREKLVNIAYSTYTRVDVRRMYGLGVLSEDQVKDAYLDLGYNEERAENMTRFTILYETSADRDLAKTELLKGYTRGVMTREATLQALTDIGYIAEDANFLVSLEDLKLAQETKDDQLSAVKANYVEGVWEVPETTAAMGKIGLTAQEEQRLLETWQIERERRIARPTTAQVLSFFDRSVISEGEARDELDKKGFSDHYIDWYISNLEAAKQDRLERESETEKRRLLTQIRSPSKAEIRVWWIGGYITEQRFREWMGEMGYLDPAIQLYVDQVEAEHERELEMMEDDELRRRFEVLRYPSKSDLKKFYLSAIIDEITYREELAEQGFTEKAIERFVELANQEMEGE